MQTCVKQTMVGDREKAEPWHVRNPERSRVQVSSGIGAPGIVKGKEEAQLECETQPCDTGDRSQLLAFFPLTHRKSGACSLARKTKGASYSGQRAAGIAGAGGIMHRKQEISVS